MSESSSEFEPTHSPPPGPLLAGPSAEQHRETIAHVAELATWVDRKFPEVVHIALTDGLAPAEAAAAAGSTVGDLAHRWQQWAQQARRAGELSPADYDHIRNVLVKAQRQA